MRSALDEFEQMLVAASRELASPASTRKQTGASPEGRRRRRWRLGGLGVLPVAWLVAAATALAAAGGVTAFLFLDQGNTAQTIASVTCMLTRNASAGVSTITGSPLTDCAAMWPSATGGRSNAPPLRGWIAVASRPVAETALVQPAAWGQPAPERLRIPATPGQAPHSVLVHWRPLPAGWTVNLGVVELTDQLQAIPSGMSPPATCIYPRHALAVVHSLLADDGLNGWHVVLQATQGAVSPGCRYINPNVDGGIKTVQLIQGPAPTTRAHHVSRTEQKLLAAWGVLDHKLVAAQQQIDTTLAHRCVSVNQASTDWTAVAGKAGFKQTSLAYYREINTAPAPVPVRLDYYYTLVKQPATQHTGSCAHVLVMQYGGGNIVVYAARIAP